MHPELLRLGPLVLHTYGLMVALGIVAAVSLAEALHRRAGGTPGCMVDMALAVVLAGLVGARLLFVLVNLDHYWRHPLETLMIWKGGLVFYGGLLGGAVALGVSARIQGIRLLDALDIGAPAVALGHAVGRIGCLFAGCCHGSPTSVPWAVTFTDPRCLATSVLGTPVHPTQLYEFAFLLLLAAALAWRHPLRRVPGRLAATYLLAYPAFRFAVEFLRGDTRGQVQVLGLSLATSQLISLAILPVGAAWFLWLGRRSRTP